jgi:DNA polymerase bacteriophage-type
VWTIDFETRSRVDIRRAGSSKYARHASTSVLCLAYSNGADVALWTPRSLITELESSPPLPLFQAINRGELIEAHNVGFERQIWYHICHKRMGWPAIHDDQWRCSMAGCCRLALPRALGQVGGALGLPVRKDDEGHGIMLQLSKPRKPSKSNPAEWVNDPGKFQKLYEYCMQDVRSEMAISRSLPELPINEMKIWQLDQKINERGIKVDRQAVENALACVNAELDNACQDLSKLTDGQATTPNQNKRLLNWLASQGCEIPNLRKETVAAWIERDDLNPLAREVLLVRSAAGKSSTAKLKAILERVDEDGRVRGNLVYHGAATGRWAGSGIQIQNFPRGTLSPEAIEVVHKLLPLQDSQAIDLVVGPPIEVISSSLRSMMVADQGHRLMVGDFAQIEARVAAWIAGQDDLVESFRRGEDVYLPMASKIYNREIGEHDKKERQVGKVAILGCQYGLGAKGFQGAVKTMTGLEVDKKFAKAVVKVYRAANPRIKAIWAELNTACIRTIETRQPHRVGMLEMQMGKNTLQIKLPSGRSLHYWYPELKQVIAPWSEGYIGAIKLSDLEKTWAEEWDIELGDDLGQGWYDDCDVSKEAFKLLAQHGIEHNLEKKERKFIKQIEYWGVDSQKKKWSPIRTYGGSIFENLVQGIARDFLAEAMLRIEGAGYPIIGTVHDEIISEVPKSHRSLSEFEELLRIVPNWGKGCPIDVEVFESERYRK